MKLIIFSNPNKPYAAELMEDLVRICGSSGVEALTARDADELSLLVGREHDSLFCVVTVGGDGTVLRAVSIASVYGIPVLGVNMGRVGFFSEIGTDEFGSALELLKKSEFFIDRASMIHCSVNGESAGECLNDFALHRQELSSITHIDLEIDGDGIGDVMADGLIVGTPSGSTAYTMSAGGPVVAPKLDCILVTPVCPHSLTVRPIVASKASVVSVRLKSACRLIRDGQNVRELRPGDELVFTSAERTAAFIRFKKRNVFKLIREKLK